MFDIGFGEMLLLAAIALVAIGPKQLPEVARVVGRMLNEFKRATSDFTRTFTDARDSTNNYLSETRRQLLHDESRNNVHSSDQPSDIPKAESGQMTGQMIGQMTDQMSFTIEGTTPQTGNESSKKENV